MTRAELLEALADADATIREQQALIEHYRGVLAQADAALRAAMARAGMVIPADHTPAVVDRRH